MDEFEWFRTFTPDLYSVNNKDFKQEYYINMIKVQNFLKKCNDIGDEGDLNFKIFSQDYRRFIYNGVNFAKACAMALGVPLIPVHHIRGHMAANYIAYPELEPPFLCLAISGGNTLLADVRDYTDMRILGHTRDDAAGECFDKTARVLGLPYPGGKPIDELARGGDDKKYIFPQAHIEENPYDMSFSGLKTAVINLVHHAEQTGEEIDRSALAASFTRAVSESLVPRAMMAAEELGYDKLVIAGGVAANSVIRRDFTEAAEKHHLQLFIPPLRLCGDNAAMIGAQGYYEYLAGHTAGTDLNAYASMDINGSF